MGVQERRAREKRARQQAILKAAQSVFFEKGLEQTTVDDIAEKAELSKGTLYLYFQSKEELYISVFLKGLDILTDQFTQLQERINGSRPDALIREMAEIYYNFFMEYPEYFYINSLLYHGKIKGKINPYTWTMTHQKTKRCLEVFAEVIQLGIDRGVFRQVDCWKTTNSFWGAVTGVMMMLNDEEHRKFIGIPIKDLFDYTTEFLVDGLTLKEQG